MSLFGSGRAAGGLFARASEGQDLTQQRGRGADRYRAREPQDEATRMTQLAGNGGALAAAGFHAERGAAEDASTPTPRPGAGVR
jgi:hypothetical protein